MTGRQYRASVISGCRRALHNALERTDRDLETAINGLLVRLGASGRVGDDVLGCVPDDWPSTPLYVRVGTADRKHDGLRHSVEFLESQPWLPASARYLAESVLKAIGRPSVRALVDRLPEPGPVAWQSLCGWAHPRRRDLPGRLRMARRALELLTGSWPWGSAWVEPRPQPVPSWVDGLLGRDRRVILDYAPLTRCSCDACVSRRLEIEGAYRRFQAGN
jgi:hypothetical protein